MKLYKIIIFVLFALCTFSCGKNDQNDDDTDSIENIDTPSQRIDSSKNTKKADSIKAIKQSILTNKKYKIKEVDSSVANKKKATNESITKNIETVKNTNSDLSFYYIKKILKDCKIGETLTQNQLSTNLEIPKDAIKLVKSIKKTSDNELDVKWKSTWLIEKVSDAKLKDGKLKVNFKDNKMYTSGGAIGIKYNNKMYTDLVITGRVARIPTVKGFYWQIGKD